MNKNVIKKIMALGGAVATAVLPILTLAQTTVSPVGEKGKPLDQLIGILNTLTTWLLTGLLTLAGILIVIAGYNYVTAAGDEEKVSRAKSMLIYAAVGVGVGLLSKIIVALAQQLVSPS